MKITSMLRDFVRYNQIFSDDLIIVHIHKDEAILDIMLDLSNRLRYLGRIRNVFVMTAEPLKTKRRNEEWIYCIN